MQRAWEVLIVVDRDCEEATIDTPSRYMPVWLIGSLGNLNLAKSLRASADGSKTREITTFDDLDPTQSFDPTSVLDVVKLHHPYMTRLNVMGNVDPTLLASMDRLGFAAAPSMWPHTIAFKKGLSSEINIPEFSLEAGGWTNADDVYSSLFAAIGAPEWHGRNFNALNDSIVTGGVNAIEVPYKLTINGLSQAGVEAQAFTRELVELLSELAEVGCPVSVEVAP